MTMVVTADMAPDSTTTNIEDTYRLVRVAVREATVRSIHQRRPAIATVTDTLRLISNAHADVRREDVTEPYSPSLGSADMGEDAYIVPNKMSVIVSSTGRCLRTHAADR